MLLDALVEEFDRRGQLRPVYGGAGTPDALRLGGVVRDFQVRPTSFSSVALAIEHEARLVIELDLERPGAAAALWQHRRLTASERFLASPDPGVEESNREEALRRMAAELAGRIHDALVQTF